MIKWLLDGDPSLVYQTKRDLLNLIDDQARKSMVKSGWGYEFLSRQLDTGHWGKSFYNPKWTSTHYTLLDLRSLEVPKTEGIEKALMMIIKENSDLDGSINSSKAVTSDVCINGMFLNYASFYDLDVKYLQPVVDFIISQFMDDGAWNCRLNRSGARHSSMHTTINTLEGIESYKQKGYNYRIKELTSMQRSAEEFLLNHKLYKSDKTGQVIHKNMTMLSYPYRWKYNVMRALDYFRFANRPYDSRMQDGLELLQSKKMKNGFYPVQAKHPGQFHFEMEKCGKASRMTTLIITRILKRYTEEE